MPYWTVAQTQPQREGVAARFLAMGAYETYLPRIKIKRPHRQTRIAPLFPSYIFVRIELFWYPVLSTIGISRVLCDCDGPVKLSDHEIAKIRNREVDGFVTLPKKRPRWRVGERIRIQRGTFQNHFAVYDGMSPGDRSRVLLNLLGRQVKVNLASSDIQSLAL